MSVVSSDVVWSVVRDNSRFLLKKRGVSKPFSTDPLNLTNLHSKRYSGSLHAKAVGIDFPAKTSGGDKKAANKGFVVSMKRPRRQQKPRHAVVAINMNKGARIALTKVRGMLVKQRYRKDLTKAALRRASAVIRSQKPLPKRKAARFAVDKKAADKAK